MESQESNVSLPPGSQPTEDESPAPAPTSQWKIWARGINKKGDWHCTHRFEDGTQTYHYVNKDGSVYMSHRDGSATYSPVDGTYIPRKGHDPDSKIPAPTTEEVIEETENVKREHREYLASPVKYWGGVRTTPHGFNIAWLFPSCDCADRYSSTYDYWDGYPDHGYGGEYLDYFGDDYEPSRAEYKAYGFDCGDEEEEGDEGDEEDEEGEDDEDDGDNGEEYTDGDRISPSPDENKAIDNQEDDKTTVRITDVAPLSLVEEAQVDVKQKIKEEPCGGPALALPTTLKTEPEVTPSSGFASDPTAFEYAATGSSAGERTSRNSGVGPDIQTEGKRILRSHRSKPY